MTVSLTKNETTALVAWVDTCEEFDVLSFKTIAARSKLDPSLIRRTVRNMARKGVTKFCKGCWTSSGEPAGSGYGLTQLGRSMLK